MCGIFAYIRSQEELKDKINPVDVCINGLKLLEYRGYDSSGIAGMIDGKIRACKRAGKIGALQEAVSSENLHLDTAIAHTRWATHGIPNQENAHPHLDQEESLAVVHNGIIENHNAIREKLAEKGVKFHSDTDTEVIAGLISYYYSGNLKTAVQKALRELHGSFAIALIHKDHPTKLLEPQEKVPLSLELTEKMEKLTSPQMQIHSMEKFLISSILKMMKSLFYKTMRLPFIIPMGKRLKKNSRPLSFKTEQSLKMGLIITCLKRFLSNPKRFSKPCSVASKRSSAPLNLKNSPFRLNIYNRLIEF